MNKKTALLLLEQGNKITHRFFSRDEFIMKHPLNPEYYLDENRTPILISFFWKYRDTLEWETDWSKVSILNPKIMSIEEQKTLDPELIEHLEHNLNNHLWTKKNGEIVSVFSMSHEERVEIYNLIIDGTLKNIPLIKEWKPIFLNSLTIPLT